VFLSQKAVMKTRTYTLLVLLAFSVTICLAQDPADSTVAYPSNAVIFLKDGTQLRGIILSE